MRLADVEPPADTSLLSYHMLESKPTPEEFGEFDRVCRKTSTFDGWDIYGEEVSNHYLVVLVNREKRIP